MYAKGDEALQVPQHNEFADHHRVMGHLPEAVAQEEDRSEPDVFAGIRGSPQPGAQGARPQDQGNGKTPCNRCRYRKPVDSHDLSSGQNGDFGSCSLLVAQEAGPESRGFLLPDDPHVSASLIIRRDFSCAASRPRE